MAKLKDTQSSLRSEAEKLLLNLMKREFDKAENSAYMIYSYLSEYNGDGV